MGENTTTAVKVINEAGGLTKITHGSNPGRFSSKKMHIWMYYSRP